MSVDFSPSYKSKTKPSHLQLYTIEYPILYLLSFCRQLLGCLIDFKILDELESKIFPSKLNTKNEKNSEFFSEHFLVVLNSYL